MKEKRKAVLAIMAAILVATLVGAGPAGAAFPGQNGRIFFSSDRSGGGNIFAMRADRKGFSAVVKASGRQSDVAVSPDGKRIAYASSGDIYAKNLVTKKVRKLTGNPKADTAPSWSPDGKRIAFSSTRDENNALQGDCDHLTNYNIYTMNADGSNEQRLGKDTPCGVDIDPAWSPKGGAIAYESYTGYQKT
jgi:Tol biopolymer transport system component